MEENKNQLSKTFKICFKSLFFEIILSLILLLVLSVVLSKTDVSEKIIKPAIIAISSVCIIIGAFWVSRKVNIKGIILGGINGFTYMIFLYLISSILSSNFSLGIESIIMILTGIICGMLGGIIGANLK